MVGNIPIALNQKNNGFCALHTALHLLKAFENNGIETNAASQTSDSVVSFPEELFPITALSFGPVHGQINQIFQSCRTMGLKSAEMLDCMSSRPSRAEEHSSFQPRIKENKQRT